MERFDHLQRWVAQQLGLGDIRIEPASEDASFRRYFRVLQKAQSLIVMDAPPSHEDCRPFLTVATLFRDAGVHVPEVLAEDLEQGFLLLSDLGNMTYLKAIAEGRSADDLYLDAIDALVRIQRATQPGRLPLYDRALLLRELKLFPEWYIARHLGVDLTPDQCAMLDACFERILARNLSEGAVYVHRDYHSRNLMVSAPNPGILDFQDAVLGPVSYDLVSLLKDAYVSWEEARVLDWSIRYWERARAAALPIPADFGEFYKNFEWMGVQRHIKVLGIFARLWHRDGKESYVKDMPLVMAYLRKACERYGELSPLLTLLDQIEGSTASQGLTF